jgi:hypothetical protein
MLAPGVNFINIARLFHMKDKKAAYFWKWISPCFFVQKFCWLCHSQGALSCAGCTGYFTQVAIICAQKSFQSAAHKKCWWNRPLVAENYIWFILIAALSLNDSHVSFCWVPLYWVSLCWMSVCWVSLCGLSLRHIVLPLTKITPSSIWSYRLGFIP